MNGGWVMVTTVVAAWILTLLPMPDWAMAFRPEWTLMVMVYWTMAVPSRVSIGWCWLAGLGLDVLMGTLMGQHAIALALVGWVVARLHLQIRVYPVWQQALVVAALVGMYEFILFWTDGIAGTRSDAQWGPVLTTALLWPWALVLLRVTRRRFRVA